MAKNRISKKQRKGNNKNQCFHEKTVVFVSMIIEIARQNPPLQLYN